MVRTIVMTVAGGGLFAAGYLSHGLSKSVDADKSMAVETASASTHDEPPIDYGRISTIIDRALVARCPGATLEKSEEASESAARQTATTATEMDLVEERAISLDRARSQIDGAIHRGTWTAEDALTMQSLVKDLLPEQRDELASAFASAVNAQQLRVDSVPPF